MALACAGIVSLTLAGLTTVLDQHIQLSRIEVLLVPGAAALLLAGISGWLIGALAATPVAQITALASQITKGNTELRAELRGGRDGVALAQAFNAMVSQLSNVNQQLEQQLREQAMDLSRSEAALAERGEALTLSQQEVEKFASVASHDLRAPLRSVLAFGEMLAENSGDALDQRGRDYLDRIIASGQRMQALITDLREYSLVSPSQAESKTVDLDKILQQVCAQLNSEISELGAKVSGFELPSMVGSEAMIKQLFMHLIGNSLKFARDNVPPLITVTASLADDDICLDFADNGIGVDARYAERIFEIFQRLHPADAYSGTGVGLAICRKIALIHGGEIRAESAPQGGALIRVRLSQHSVAASSSQGTDRGITQGINQGINQRVNQGISQGLEQGADLSDEQQPCAA